MDFWTIAHEESVEGFRSTDLRHPIHIHIYLELINVAVRIYNKKKKRGVFTSTLYLQLALATHARFKYALYHKRDSLERHQAAQPCKRTMYIYLVLSFDF